ncbi:hypothetical protein AGIG_G19315 [Arapaima gigas]
MLRHVRLQNMQRLWSLWSGAKCYSDMDGCQRSSKVCISVILKYTHDDRITGTHVTGQRLWSLTVEIPPHIHPNEQQQGGPFLSGVVTRAAHVILADTLKINAMSLHNSPKTLYSIKVL